MTVLDDPVATEVDETAPPRVRFDWTGVVGGVALFAILVLTNLDLLRTRILEDGDFAANSILIDKAVSGPLLHGNYSRVGFYHPGPAILDAQAAGQFLFHRLLGVVPSPFDGQFLGILVLNAVCVGIAVAIGARLLRSRIGALALVPAVLMILWWIPYGLASTWMPHTYICPFLLLCVSAAAVAGGSWRDLRWLAFAAGVTIHGHVSFVLFATVTAGAAVASAWLVHRRWRDREDADLAPLRRSDLAWAAGIAALFALPIVADLVFHWPGQVKKYIKFASDKTGFVPRSVRDVAHFVRQYWMPTGWALLPVLAVAVGLCVVVARLRPGRTRRFLVAALGVCVLETLLLAYYGFRGVDDLSETYVGYFAMSLPVVVLWLGGASLVELIGEKLPRRAGWAGIVVALAFVPSATQGTFANPYRGMRTDRLSDAIGPRPVRLEFSTAGWPSALGLIEERRRQDRGVCVTNPVWSILVTSPLICGPHAPGRLVAVLGPGEPPPAGARRFASVGGTDLADVPG